MKYTTMIEQLHQDALLKREKQEKLKALSTKMKVKSALLADLNMNGLLIYDGVWCDKPTRLPLEIFNIKKSHHTNQVNFCYELLDEIRLEIDKLDNQLTDLQGDIRYYTKLNQLEDE
ncbi:hypothetical protein DX143_03830 [Listeria monocytogenes]|nr:hypothetical protein [Listeria monocytogenes]